MIDHLDSRWKLKKGMGYPWTGMEFKRLQGLARRCDAWGVMALWDLYMSGTSYWGARTGYMLDGFWRDLGVLIDDFRFKQYADKYHDQLEPPQEMAPIADILKGVGLCQSKKIE